MSLILSHLRAAERDKLQALQDDRIALVNHAGLLWREEQKLIAIAEQRAALAVPATPYQPRSGPLPEDD